MKFHKKLIITSFTILISLVIWSYAEQKDYFQSHYRILNSDQQKIFKSNLIKNQQEKKDVYIKHFSHNKDTFPGQCVTKVKLFRNIPILGQFRFKTLKSKNIKSILSIFNNSQNFDWGETTWGLYESEYYLKFYNSDNKVVGKIYLCLNDCGMIDAKPFSPSMKAGQLSPEGIQKINTLINENNFWE